MTGRWCESQKVREDRVPGSQIMAMDEDELMDELAMTKLQARRVYLRQKELNYNIWTHVIASSQQFLAWNPRTPPGSNTPCSTHLRARHPHSQNRRTLICADFHRAWQGQGIDIDDLLDWEDDEPPPAPSNPDTPKVEAAKADSSAGNLFTSFLKR